jgi:hypothetical protein
VPTVPPLAPAKVLRTDALIPTRRRSSRGSRQGTSAAAGTSSQGPAEASGARPADQPAAAQPEVAGGRPAPVATEAQAAAVATVEVPPAVAATTEEAERAQPAGAPADVAARTVVAATAPRRAPVVAEAQVEAPAEAAQVAPPAGGPQAEVVELSDDSPPPGWNQWASWPANSPEPQEGALVKRHEGRMTAGGRGHDAEASSSRAGRPAQVGGAVEDPPAFADARGEQELWGELLGHGATLNRALNEALRVHSGPAWTVFQVSHGCSFPFLFSFSRAALKLWRLRDSMCVMPGARAPRSRKV